MKILKSCFRGKLRLRSTVGLALGRATVAAVLIAAGASANAGVKVSPCPEFLAELDGKVPQELKQYQSYADIGLKPTKTFDQFKAQQDFSVTARDASGHATQAQLRVLADNDAEAIEVVGDFNKWGLGDRIVMKPDPSDSHYKIATIKNIKHGDQYRLVINGQSIIDPAALSFSNGDINHKYYKNHNDDFLNSIFYDLDRPEAYKQKNPITDLRASAITMTEIELGHLVNEWWYDYHAGPKEKVLTYKFVTESGIIDYLKAQGINAIEFLPINASLDPDDANYRYQVFGPFGVDARYGTPDDFAQMIDKFNEAKIKVVMDIVPGHYPFFGNKGDRKYDNIGPQVWKKQNGTSLYGSNMSPWNTYRYDYQNPYVRRYLIDGVLTMIKRYRLGGIRIDNYGEIWYIPGGQQFLTDLVSEVKAYAPEIWINGESFGGDNYVTRRRDWGGHGANAHNNADFFELIKDSIENRTEDLNMEQIRQVLRNPWQWLEALNLYLLTNHDEARNGRGGATGQYLASAIKYGDNWPIVEGKIRAFATLAMVAGTYYMDMPQLRLMQEGNYKDNPNVKWSLLLAESQRNMAAYFADMSLYRNYSGAFAPYSVNGTLENHTDYDNKIISIERRDAVTGKKVITVINLGHHEFSNYRFGVNSWGKLRVAIDGDNVKYGGRGYMARGLDNGGLWVDNQGMHGKDHSIRIPFLASYGVVVLEETDPQ